MLKNTKIFEAKNITVNQFLKGSTKVRRDYCIEHARRRWIRSFDQLPKEIQKAIYKAEEIKIFVKNGHTSVKLREKVEELDNLINQPVLKEENVLIKDFLKKQLSAFYFQTQAILSEQYHRWNMIDKAQRCAEDGESILNEITLYNKKYRRATKLTGTDKEIKEQIRLCLAYIQAFSYQNSQSDKYNKTLKQLKNIKEYVLSRKKSTEDKWFGTLAHIESYLGRCYRNLLQYDLSVRCFGQSLSYYEQRADQSKNRYPNNLLYQESEKNFVKHRTALILIAGFAWIDILHGKLFKALYNSLFPAKTLLESMNDTPATNLLYILETAALRWLSLPNYCREGTQKIPLSPYTPQDALDKINFLINKIGNSEEKDVFNRLSLQILYELALCLEYSENWEESLATAQLMIKDGESSNDSFWKGRSYILKARVLTRQWYNQGSKQKNKRALKPDFPEREIFDLFEKAEESCKKNIQTHLEFFLYQGEAYLCNKDYDDALASFNQALLLNRSLDQHHRDEIHNPKIEASCRIRLAKIFINKRMFLAAKEEIRIWDETLASIVDDNYLHYLAEKYKLEFEVKLPNKHIVEINQKTQLTFKENLKELKFFLLNRAIELEGNNFKWEDVRNNLGLTRPELLKWRTQLKIHPPTKKS